MDLTNYLYGYEIEGRFFIDFGSPLSAYLIADEYENQAKFKYRPRALNEACPRHAVTCIWSNHTRPGHEIVGTVNKLVTGTYGEEIILKVWPLTPPSIGRKPFK